jgi:hypothetical protein
MKPRIKIEINGAPVLEVYCHPETSPEQLQRLLLDAAELIAETEQPGGKILPFRREE